MSSRWVGVPVCEQHMEGDANMLSCTATGLGRHMRYVLVCLGVMGPWSVCVCRLRSMPSAGYG
jgi:hypothetical protein